MPEEVHRELFQITVEGQQAQDTLNRILQSLEKIQSSMANLGGQIDRSISRLAEPMQRLSSSVDALNASISSMQQNLGNVQGLKAQSQAAQQTAVDYANLRAAMAAFRTGAGAKQPFRDPIGHRGMSQEQLVERYMGGRYAEMGYGPGLGAPPAAGFAPPTMMGVSGRLEPGAQRDISAGLEATTASAEQETVAVKKLNDGLLAAIEAKKQAAAASEQEAAAEDSATAAVQRYTDAITEQYKAIGRRREAAAGGQRQEASEAQRVLQLEQEKAELQRQQTKQMARPVTPVEERAILSGITPGDMALREAEEAAGRKIVTQSLLARGAKDVAEKFERQFRVTRSKAEVLREVAQAGKLTADQESELGLKTQQASQKTQRSSRLLTSMRNTLIRYFAVWQTMRAIKSTMRDWMQSHVEMDQALSQFAWRLSSSEAALSSYANRLTMVAVATGTAVKELATPLGMTADPATLAAAARAQRMFGGEVQDWLRTLEDGTGILDTHAAAMRVAAMTTQEYAKIIQASTALAEEWNMQTGEAAGLMAGLAATTGADEQEVVALSKALSNLYNINEQLIRAGSGPAVVVGAGGAQQRRPITEVMGEIGGLPIEAQRQLAIEMGMTSQEQQQLFLDAVAGWGQVEQVIRETTSATGEFDRAVAATDDSLKAHVDSMKQAWSAMLVTIGDTEWTKDIISAISGMFASITSYTEESKLSWADYIEYLKETYEYTTTEAWLRSGGPISFGEWRVEQQKVQARGAAAPLGVRGAGAAAPAPPAPTGPAAWQQFRTLRLPEDVKMERVIAEMERIITEEFIGVYQTATGELIEVTRAQIDAERQLTLVLEEEGRRKPVDLYGPAWQQALQNVQEEMKDLGRLNLERLRDITPAQFDVAMQTRLPYWEGRLQEVPGMEEEPEWQNFFVGQQDVGRRQLATQTAMQYTLMDILETSKKALEGQWNIPANAIMRVPLQSLDLLRWMQMGAGPGAPGEGFPAGMGPEVPTDLMQPVDMAATNLTGSATQLDTAAINLTGSAASLSKAAMEFGARIYGDVPVEPGVAREAALEGGVRWPSTSLARPGEVREMELEGGVRGIQPRTAAQAAGGRQVNAEVQLTTTVQLDSREVAKSVETHQVRDLQAAVRGRVGGLRPVLLVGLGLLPLLAQFLNNAVWT